jgi:predicted NAD-dependent protein-ADP-ribosyltransferase YbiA (DUF1768 family)
MAKSRKTLYTEVSPLGEGRLYRAGDWQKVPEIVHDAVQIKGFFGDYRWLSNFGQATIVLDGLPYESVERAYQAAKWRQEDRGYFEDCTNQESITYNRENTPNKYTPAEWDRIKVDVMRFLLEQKYHPELNPENALRLLDTGMRYIEETNWWNDTFWGKNLQGEGENNLGMLIMAIRSDLKAFGV